ncbi:MAG: ATP-binding protein [Gammaproteobacteria bacterium]|nr:ATP-binding protein [Gammaproteobacteria bacterium]
MLRSSFHNWSLQKRLYIIAIMATFCTVVSVAANIFTIQNYHHNVEHVSEGELVRLNYIAYAVRELSNIHTEQFTLFKTAGKKQTEQQIYLNGSILLDRIDKLHHYLTINQLKASQNTKIHPYKNHIKYITDELKTYRNTTSVAIEMISVNPALSEKYMLKATTSFNRLNTMLSVNSFDISEHINEELKEELSYIRQIYWPASILILIVAGMITPFIFMTLKDLTGSLQQVGTILEKLRTGDTKIDIPTNVPDQQMQMLYHSLEQFRQTLIKLRETDVNLSEKNSLLTEESNRRQLTEHELRRSLEDLSQATKAAQASNKAKSLFLANMSHEIRTPLNAVLGMAQMLQTTDLDETQQDYMETLYTQGKHLLQLLNSFLDFSRMESGKFTLTYEAFHLDKLIDEISSLFSSNQDKQHIKLTIEINKDVDNELYGDPLRIRQILINLLSNAYKFTEQGTIRIHIQNSPNKPECVIDRPGQCPNRSAINHCHWHSLYITVTDTGIGINKATQGYIFENFTQADESHTRQYGGTGIGLAICKQLVELMDGEIGVNSEPGKGSSFWFRICLPDSVDAIQNQTA